MDATNQAGDGQRIFRFVDIGLAVGLLVAVLAVVAIDRSAPVEADPGVDLVFVLDQRPDMRDLIEGMKANCLEKAESLKAAGVDCRFAVIPFGKKQHRVPTVAMTGDLADFKAKLLASAEGGPDAAAESGTEALEQALTLDFRKNAQILFCMISKTPSQEAQQAAAVASRMNERGITAIIQAETPKLIRVALSGDLHSLNVGEIEKKLTELLAGHGKDVIVDMSKVPSIMSLGIGMLITISKMVTQGGRKFVLLKPQPAVATAIQTARLSEMLGVALDEATAQSMLSETVA